MKIFIILSLIIAVLLSTPSTIDAQGGGIWGLLDVNETVTLTDMQVVWGFFLPSWVGPPSCSWDGLVCDVDNHVTKMYVRGNFSVKIIIC